MRNPLICERCPHHHKKTILVDDVVLPSGEPAWDVGQFLVHRCFWDGVEYIPGEEYTKKPLPDECPMTLEHGLSIGFD